MTRIINAIQCIFHNIPKNDINLECLKFKELSTFMTVKNEQVECNIMNEYCESQHYN